jgi:lipoprotein NlpI
MRGAKAALAGTIAALLAAGGAAAQTPLGVTPQSVQLCRSSAPAARASACTALIDSGALVPGEAALAHYFRGFAERDLRQDETALGDFDAALRLDGTLWPAYWVRAELREARRDYAAAAADWQEIIRRRPRIAGPYENRGNDLDNLGNSAEAVGVYTQAIALAGPKDNVAGFHVDRAVAFEGEHQYDKAKADFNEAITRAPTEIAFAGRGRVRYLSGDFAGAASDFARAAELNRGDNYMLLWLYLAEAHAGRNAVALLRQRAAERNLAEWPGPIVRVFLGELKPEQVAPPALPADWPAAVRKAAAQCELSFYVAELRLLRHEPAKAAALFRATVATGIKEYVEYRAAAFELGRLGH